MAATPSEHGFHKDNKLSLEKLVRLVSEHPCLYDTTDSNYKDMTIKNNTWIEIGYALGANPEACKKKWIYLRDTYIRKRKEEILTGQVKRKKWWLSDAFYFLDNHSRIRKFRPVYYVTDIREPPVCKWYNIMEYFSSPSGTASHSMGESTDYQYSEDSAEAVNISGRYTETPETGDEELKVKEEPNSPTDLTTKRKLPQPSPDHSRMASLCMVSADQRAVEQNRPFHNLGAAEPHAFHCMANVKISDQQQRSIQSTSSTSAAAENRDSNAPIIGDQQNVNLQSMAAAAEQRALLTLAAAEVKAAQQRTLENMIEPKASEKRVAEQRAAEQRALLTLAAAEIRAAEQRAFENAIVTEHRATVHGLNTRYSEGDGPQNMVLCLNLEQLFLALARNVATFPPAVQAAVKRDICKIIMEAECSLYSQSLDLPDSGPRHTPDNHT